MCAQRYVKVFFPAGLFLFFLLASPYATYADVESYSQSCQNAKNNAITPSTTWLAASSSIINIPDTGSAHGLTYDSGNLIVRTASGYGDFAYGYYVQSNYQIRPDRLPTNYAAWVTAGNDMTRFYNDKGVGVTGSNAVKFVERGLGMNTDASHIMIIEYSVNPADDYIMRPARNPDIATYDPTQYGDGASFVQPIGMSDTVYNNFTTYYESWRTDSAPGKANQFPWTQLGYTYYWGTVENPPTALLQVQGMTEFIILAQTYVNLYAIYATQSYIYTKNDGSDFSTASAAQFGNGFASFDVTGACDTVWAGHRFQKNVRRYSSSPNEIIIESGATVTTADGSGQGILVWSLNYDVTNNGTISGATTMKFGLTGTDNVAVLFQGDTTTAYGSPVTEGINKLTNSGTISSAGTVAHPPVAVEVVNGNTRIINTGTIASEGTIADSCAIWLKAGANTVTNSNNIGKVDDTNYSDIGILIDSNSTTITNNTGGTIYGNSYAIWLTGGSHVINNYAAITSPATAIQIDAGTTSVTNSGAGVITGNVVVSNNSTAALDIGNKDLTIGGNYTQNASATLKVTANSAADFGTLTATNVSNASSKLSLTIGGYIPDNTTLSNVVNGTGVSIPGTISSSSPVFTFAGSVAAGKLSLTATRANSYQSLASNSSASVAGAALDSILTSGDPQGDMLTVFDNLDSMTSSGQINEALTTLTPNVDNSAPQTTQATQGQFLSAVFAQLDGFKNIMSNVPKGLDVWANGFGSYLHQDAAALSNGYDATIWGTAMGGDVPALDHLRLGLSGAFAQDFVRTKDSSSRTDIDSYQAAFYGSYAKDAYYIDTGFAFAYNNYDTSRQVALGALSRTATGEYNGQQYAGYIAGGYKFIVKHIEVTPVISFLYSHLRLNSYTEDGAGSLSLRVDAQDYDTAQTGLGMKAGYPFNIKFLSSKVTPELEFSWLYDWSANAQQITSNFTGGGASFSTQGFVPAQSSYVFGTKITVETGNNITLSLDYDLEIKEDFYAHYGTAEIRYRF